ncbi:quinol monooxygenase YgiN [Amycolatopsis bartoniae]|uniref:ABM domain-containing protein n=1 Tax=Amycolatopsis bartoniae TaxID=941986 RepID=A0A8H9IXP0_9PSEU|nr:antibiotic biosynthesis monooxygenase [Amycolatopsis bartoniae]MBB2940096.1 quinol monooxygenase YgiN [Amycolatopsis bartoniae]TVT07722.1 hypothetical protein FNH07_15380 [Amycolatopsis bartoniae]GHF53920.1 hypothetical protein GCM10017566_29250 [Amycolatopsis bartoniae]
MSFFVRARFEVPPRRRAEFEQLALALREQARDEPGTLTYRWFSAGQGSYTVIEQYTDPAAGVAHNQRAAALLERVAGCAELMAAEIYGSVDDRLRSWAAAQPQVTVLPEVPQD